MGVVFQILRYYNFVKIQGTDLGAPTMENDLKKLISELLETITDSDLLDLLYKILLELMQASNPLI